MPGTPAVESVLPFAMKSVLLMCNYYASAITRRESERQNMNGTEVKVKLVSADRLLETLFEPESRPTKRTLWNWVRNGYVRAIHIGKSVFFDAEEVRATLEAKRRGKRKATPKAKAETQAV